MRGIVRKVVALGAGAAMLGATLMGAMALDLSNYPAPFVQNGQFSGYLVVGRNAKAADVIGATDIGMSLQAANVVEKTTSGTTETVMDSGVKIETSSNKLTYGEDMSTVKGTLTDADLPILLGKTTVTDTDGTSYDVLSKIKVMDSTVVFGRPISDVNEPTLYLDTKTGTPTYEVDIQFPTAVNLSMLKGQTIKLFGNEYTISDTSGEVSDSMLTLYSAALDQTFNAGDPETTVSVGGTDVAVQVIGVSTSGTKGTIKVNGETKTVEAAHTYTIGGQRVYVKDVYAYDQPVGGGGVRLFIGSQKIVLSSGDSVAKGVSSSDYIDGTEATFSSSGGKVSDIKVTYTPANQDPSVEYLKAGDELDEPVFGAFKYSFLGPEVELKADTKSTVKVWSSSEDKMSIEFTNKDGQHYSTEFVKGNATNQTHLMVGDYKLEASGNNVSKDEYFILGTDEYQHIFRLSAVRNSSSTQKITVKDIADDGTTSDWSFDKTTGEGTMVYDGNTYYFRVTGSGTSDGYVEFFTSDSYSAPYNFVSEIYTNDDNKVALDNESVVITEKTTYTGGTPTDYGTLTIPIAYSEGRSGNDVYITSTPTYTLSTGEAWSGAVQVGGSNYDYEALTPFGTYMEYTGGDNPVATFYVPKEEVTYSVYVSPLSAVKKQSGANTYEEVVKINPDVTVFDDQISDVTAQNLIVVGGPCVNSVAATLFGNPTDCTQGFEQGKAMIKLFEQDNGNVALLVAGYAADDTRRAAKVLANYDDYADKLQGKEVIVSGTDFTNINVEAPASE